MPIGRSKAGRVASIHRCQWHVRLCDDLQLAHFLVCDDSGINIGSTVVTRWRVKLITVIFMHHEQQWHGKGGRWKCRSEKIGSKRQYRERTVTVVSSDYKLWLIAISLISASRFATLKGSMFYRGEVSVKKERIALNETSPITELRDVTGLPATRDKWTRPALIPAASKLVLDLHTPEG